jgi:DSF synthase
MNDRVHVGLQTMLGRLYKTIRLEWTQEYAMLRVRTCVKPIQCYSLAAMAELQQLLHDIAAMPGTVRHFVMTSDVPQVFNFGGDEGAVEEIKRIELDTAWGEERTGITAWAPLE